MLGAWQIGRVGVEEEGEGGVHVQGGGAGLSVRHGREEMVVRWLWKICGAAKQNPAANETDSDRKGSEKTVCVNN